MAALNGYAMKRSHAIANALALLALLGLALAALLAVARLGPLGLVILGLLALFICSQVDLDDDAPTWGPAVFRARMARPVSPEQRAAIKAERQAALSPLRFYRICGIVLVVAGAVGFAWEQLRP